MLDETIITETPPLYYSYSRIGQQQRVRISGNRAKRIVHGALNVWSGEAVLLVTTRWDQITHQEFLRIIRRHWRGWHIVLFEDRGSPHTAHDSLELATALDIQVRFLPRATPELNAMDQLWRQTKPYAVANCSTLSVDTSAMQLCDDILALRPHERLQKAGVFSGNFWLLK